MPPTERFVTTPISEAWLQSNLTFEKLISELSTYFIDLTSETIDSEIQQALDRLLSFFKVDRISVLEFTADCTELLRTYTSSETGNAPTSSNDWPHEEVANERSFVQGQYKSHLALLTAGVDINGEETTLRLESQGALSLVDGGLFPSNTIYDSFAIVDTGPMAHVHVLQENCDVGRTNSAGRLLVPDMRSFDLNHFAIEPTDIPPDTTIDVTTREVRPQDRSGVVIRFPIEISYGALLQLVDEASVPLPVGSTATLRSTGSTFPVGYDGDAYVQNLGPHNEVRADLPDGRRCSVAFDYLSAPGEIPTIGPLTCRQEKQ